MMAFALNYKTMRKVNYWIAKGFTMATIAGEFRVTTNALKDAIDDYSERTSKKAPIKRARRADNFIPTSKEDRSTKLSHRFGFESETSAQIIRRKSEKFIAALRKYHGEREVKK